MKTVLTLISLEYVALTSKFYQHQNYSYDIALMLL
jgi:hypothetical protein